ncbi:hypothetical protein [Simkania negevensis]|uniref:Bacterial toxin 24 domain-containing protein n=1 Tax=Simkania negevensis (strain ATCC VR-1471 / DSM 27360 / Z) TaxID=331113 RepID=F8L6W5_SIMNZ|nr:hypothetical protein [Simkania negevensis]CCB88469.1 hypothetical protein SNE_A05920 [Simkania negevensis Z]
MKVFRVLLFFCFPTFLLGPVPSSAFEPNPCHIEKGQELFIPRDENGLINPWGYFSPRTILTHLDSYVDDVFAFVDLLTNVDFLESLCDEEAERLIDFVIFNMRFSVPKNRIDLAEKYEHEIAELLELMYGDKDDEEECQLLLNQDFHWEFAPAVGDENPEFLLCKKKKKSWVERKWHHFTHWVDKNKAPIIAVSAVAIGATVIALTMGGGAGAGVAVGGALVGVATEGDSPSLRINKPGEVHFRGDSPEFLPPHPVPLSESIAILPFEDFQYSDQNLEAAVQELALDFEGLAEELECVKEEILESTNLELFNNTDEAAKEIARAFAVEQLRDSLKLVIVVLEEVKQDPELKAAEFIIPNGSSKAVSKIGALVSKVLGLGARTTTGIGTAVAGSALTNADSPISNRYIDPRLPNNPDDLLIDTSWIETTHPEALGSGHRAFENQKTGERLHFDEGKPGEPGHKGRSHWHRINPNMTGNHDKYLDANGNPVAKGSPDSHLYSTESKE